MKSDNTIRVSGSLAVPLALLAISASARAGKCDLLDVAKKLQRAATPVQHKTETNDKKA